ncbi:MAG: hypothetical protein HYX92_08685 [Chloroflexi bacterium]|nr:hypothetical protein [Chloroflexota bacterium]
MRFQSKIYEVEDAWEWAELAFKDHLTDGLPVLPPTEERVAAIVGYLGREPQEVLGLVPPQNGKATVEKVAINCAMAGCLPEYGPVVLAALEALLQEEFNLYGVETTTHPCEPLTIVSGPIVKELGFNYGDGVFGGGSRANATIGRAIRLILWNIGGAYPGDNAKSPFSHPGRYTYCIAENGDENPWAPLHRERGIEAESGVTVFGCEAPHSIIALADEIHILNVIADSMSTMGNNNIQYTDGSQTLLVLAPRVAQKLDKAGWKKTDVKAYLFEKARRRLGDLKKGFYTWDPDVGNPAWAKWVDQRNDDTMVPIVDRPEDIIIAVAGGTSAHWFSMWCPGWGKMGGLAVSRPVGSK